MCVIHSFAPFVHSFIHPLRHSFIPPSLSLLRWARGSPGCARRPRKKRPGVCCVPVALDGVGVGWRWYTPPRPQDRFRGILAVRGGGGGRRRRGLFACLAALCPRQLPPPLCLHKSPRAARGGGHRAAPGQSPSRRPPPAAQLARQGADRRNPPGPGTALEGNVKNLQAHCCRLVRRRGNAQLDHQHVCSPTIHHLIHFCNLNFWGPPPFKPICDIGVFSLHSPHPFPLKCTPSPPSRSLSSEPCSLILDEYYFALFVGQAQLCYWR